jgi:uncharacterized protein (DUF1330 family)
MTSDQQVLLFIQGRARPYGSTAFEKFRRGTESLLDKYRGEILASGGGIASSLTDEEWPVNAVVRFPSLADAEGYLSDPIYRKVQQWYRDEAYTELRMSLVAPSRAAAASLA